MASLIPGFEYDIFISYRQKDNKGDRWVSEFVETLKTELASTFKEEIRIYFDVNPHDGLLETHDVDASLKEKLRCAIFIPVLSRTYCDPTSFAWEQEFNAFIKQASGDQFGLKVKLSNGNMTSRILPVRIHDLDPEDMRLLETQIDLIHPVDFIYYSQGVNRPLRKQDDSIQDIKQLIYRDQLNKTALAVKEIIVGLKGERVESIGMGQDHREKERDFYVYRKPSTSVKRKLLVGAGIMAILVLVTLFVYPGIIRRQGLDRLKSKDGKIPIVVMPFQNMTNDTLWNVWQDGIQSILITSLSSSEDLKVRTSETVNGILENKGLTNYASITPSVAGLISKNLETTIYIQGSIKQSGSTIRVNARLAETKTGEALQSFQVDGTVDNPLPAIDTLSIRILKFLLISVMKKQLDPDSRGFILTSSPEALRYFINGTKATDPPSALEWYRKAVEADSNFFDGLNNLWFTSLNMGMIKQGKQVCLRIYRKKDIWGLSERLWADYQYAYTFQTAAKQVGCLKKVIENDELVTSFHWVLGILYSSLEQYDKAIPELIKTIELCKKWQMKPWAGYYIALGDAYQKAGQYRKSNKFYKMAEEDAPSDKALTFNQAVLAISEGDSVTTDQYIRKYISLCKDQSQTEGDIDDEIGYIYDEAGIPDKAEKYYRKALSLEPEIPYRSARLGYFLIDKDRNIDEGLELIDKIMKLRPESVTYLHYKGWGLYKQKKYLEALEMLQKSWDLRMEKARYDHTAFLHLEAARKAVAGLK